MRKLFFSFLLASAASFAQTNTLVVLNKEGASAWLINPETTEVIAKIYVGDGPHEGAVSADGKILVVCNYGANRTGGNTLSVINITERKLVKNIDISPYSWPHGISFLQDGKHVLVTSESKGFLLKINIQEEKIVDEYNLGTDLHMVALDKNEDFAYTTSIRHGKLSRINLQTGNIKHFVTGAGTEAIGINHINNEIWIGNNQENKLKIIDASSLKIIDEIDCGLQPIRLTVTVDGKFVLVSNILSGDLAVFDAEKRKMIKRIPLGGFVLKEEQWKNKSDEEIKPFINRIVEEGSRPIGVLVEPDNHFAYIANRGLDHIAVLDLKTWEIVKRIPAGKGPDGMAWSRIKN